MNAVRIVGGRLAGSGPHCSARGWGAVRPLRDAADGGHSRPQTDRLAELVCSNSFKSTDVENAHGLLKAELGRLGCRLLEIAHEARVPAGSALGVDRERFAELVTAAVKAEPLITLVRAEREELVPGEVTIVATGPLTSDALSRRIEDILGAGNLAFYDAISPIVSRESLVAGTFWAASRYDKGGADYLNCPLDRELYEAFIDGLLGAELYPLKDFEAGAMFFEGVSRSRRWPAAAARPRAMVPSNP